MADFTHHWKWFVRGALGSGAALPTVTAALAVTGVPTGKYAGTQRQGPDGNGSAHHVSFTVQNGTLRKLVIRAGQAYCHPPKTPQPGFAPGYFNAPSPKLSGFPAVKLRKRRNPIRYYVSVTYKRAGKRWKITYSKARPDGPGFMTIIGYFTGKRFVAARMMKVAVQYGAGADGKPTFRAGIQQCNFAGRLTARQR